MTHDVWAVIMTLQNGTKGYHSVWSSQDAARRHAALRRRYADADTSGLIYRVKRVKPLRSGKDWHNKTQVSFRDSVGWMVVLD
jgi:hypothetical protein